MENKPLEGTKLYLDGKWIKRYQYVVTMTKKGAPGEVAAVVVTARAKDLDMMRILDEKFPDWNVKAINRLYEDDFKGG